MFGLFRPSPVVYFSTALVVGMFSWIQNVSALTIAVSPAPGTYKESIVATLTPDIADAKDVKIFYGFNPDGSPNDYQVFSGGILLTTTTPLVWYGFIDEKTESAISIEKYIFDYSHTFTFTGAKAHNGVISGIGVSNEWSKTLSATGWKVRAGKESHPLPARTFTHHEAVLLPDLANTGTPLELVAPDGSVQASLSPEQLINGTAYAPKSALVASLLETGFSSVGIIFGIIFVIVTVGCVRLLWRVRKIHGTWRDVWNVIKQVRAKRRDHLQKAGK